jgi:eukaryotic-like serine/threonine-protein kinase
MSHPDQPLAPPPGGDPGRPLAAARSTTFAEGDLVSGRFRVIRFIARGGMGEVYEAQDLELDERVAIKTIRPDIAADERVNQRFRREVQLARKITHPNICRIFDLFQHQHVGHGPSAITVSFVTMELLAGETLSQRLRREGAMTADQARPIVLQMAAALGAAHAADIVHRDFKTSNVLLLPAARDWEPARVVVTDFGLAYSVSDSTRGVTLSGSGDLLGTPDYMAPEQVEGGPVTPATDVYALGIVLYEMVTGVRPFTGDTPIASALRRVAGPPARPARELAPKLPAVWDSTIMTCLSRVPSRRFPDASFVVRALDPGGTPQPRPGVSARLVLAAAAVLAVLVGGVFAWRAWSPPLTGARAEDAIRTGRGAPAAAPAPAARPAAAVSAAPRPAVAVLGFRNLANRQDAQWLATALSEMVTTELGAGESVRTVPGENVNRMKIELALADTDSFAPETLGRIRENLGTDLVVFGSYVAVGSGDNASLRVDIRLQDSRQGETLALVSESGRAAELLDLVSRAGVRLRERIGVDAAPAVLESIRASQPSSSDARRLYAEGLARLRQFDALGARALLDRAVQADASFPLAHSALARTWSTLGYDARAREAAARAFELSSGLGRAERLQVEGTYREMATAWPEAIEIWRTLASFFPDDVEHVLRLANAQVAAGAPRDGLATIERFRARLPNVKDPRLELTEAAAAETLSDFKRMDAAATAAATAAERQGAKLVVALARLRQGAAALRQGRQDAAVRFFEDARTLYDAAGDRAGVARALNNLASASSDGPDTRRTKALYEEGLAIARAVGEQNLVARFLSNMAIQERRAGNLQSSLRMNQESLAIRSEIGDKTNGAISLNNIGNVLLDMGNLASASEHYQQSATLSREIGDRRGLARALFNQAESLRLQGKLARARETGAEALAIRKTIDDPAGVATSTFGVGLVAALQGDLREGQRLLAEAQAMDRKLDRRRPVAYGLYNLAEIALVKGDLAAARRQHQEALDIRTALGEKGTAAESRAALAALSLEEGQPAAAEAVAREAVAVFEGQMASDNEATTRAVLAMALSAQGRQAAAAREIVRARALVKSSQNVLARLPVAIASARVESVADARGGAAAAEIARREAEQIGLPRYAFEARRAIVEALRRSSPPQGLTAQAALRKDAAARGFALFAR